MGSRLSLFILKKMQMQGTRRFSTKLAADSSSLCGSLRPSASSALRALFNAEDAEGRRGPQRTAEKKLFEAVVEDEATNLDGAAAARSGLYQELANGRTLLVAKGFHRSEERRVGKECRA